MQNVAKFRRTLGWKIALWMSLLLIVIFAVLTLTNTAYQRQLIEQRELEASRTLSSSVLESIRYPMMVGDMDVIQKQFQSIKGQNPDLTLHVLDSQGVIRRSTELLRIKEKSQARDLSAALAGKEVSGVEFSERLGYSVFTELKPIAYEGDCAACHDSGERILGVLQVSKDFRPTQAAVMLSQRRNLIVSGASFVVAVLLLIILIRIMHRPLARVVALTRRIAKGELAATLRLKRRDEIGELAYALDQMVLNLRGMVTHIQQSAQSVAQASADISRNTNQLAEGAQSQAATLEETSTSIEELTASIEQVALNAQSQTASVEENSSGVEAVKNAAAEVSKALEGVMGAIGNISKSSEKITGIVNVIS